MPLGPKALVVSTPSWHHLLVPKKRASRSFVDPNLQEIIDALTSATDRILAAIDAMAKKRESSDRRFLAQTRRIAALNAQP